MLQYNDEDDYDLSNKGINIAEIIGGVSGFVAGPIVGYAIGVALFSPVGVTCCVLLGFIIGPILGSNIGEASAGPRPRRREDAIVQFAFDDKTTTSSRLMSDFLGSKKEADQGQHTEPQFVSTLNFRPSDHSSESTVVLADPSKQLTM